MKKIKWWVVVMMAGMLSFNVMAEGLPNVDITKLNQTELIAYQNLKKKAEEQASQLTLERVTPERLSKYAEIGKAFGDAFESCWSTVSDDAERFAQSDAGKLTMILIAWKIMGSDAMNLGNQLVHYTLGSLSFFLFIGAWIYAWKKIMSPRRVIESKKGWLFWKTITYGEEKKPIIDEFCSSDAYWITFWMVVLFPSLIGLSSWITFSG